MKSRRAPPLDESDSRLFREAIGEVRQFTPVAQPPAAAQPRPRAHMFEADEAAVAGDLLDMRFDPALLEMGDELSYLREGYPPRLLRALRRGHYSVQDELDLHHMNAAAAQRSLADFLAEVHHEGLHCVRIIHGKGLRSKAAGPVLKRLTDRLLRRRDDVIAFASARPAQGGTGAVIVLLKG